MKICPKCGKKLRDEAVFCSECGNDVKEVSPYEEPQQLATQENHVVADSGFSGIIPVILGGFSVLIALLSFLTFMNPKFHGYYVGLGLRNAFGTSLPAFVTIILTYIDISNGKKKNMQLIAIFLAGFALFLLFINALVFGFNR